MRDSVNLKREKTKQPPFKIFKIFFQTLIEGIDKVHQISRASLQINN
jgi:hypothetical protein